MAQYRGYYYTTFGVGTPILLLHGWGANGDVFGELCQELSLNYKVYVLDFLGFGRSDVPPSNYKIYDYACDIKCFIRDVIGESVILLGHSFGGRVCLLLGNEPCVNGLILIDSAGIKPRFSLKKYLQIKKYKRAKQKVANNKLPKTALKDFGSNDYKNLTENLKKVFVRIVNEDLSQTSKTIRCKTLILWGSEDRDTPLYMAKKLHRSIKNSKLVIFKNCGHYSFFDNTAGTIKEIYRFLEGIDNG